MARKTIAELNERTDFDDTCELAVHDGINTFKATAMKTLLFMSSIKLTAESAHYAILPTDFLVTMDATAGNRNLTLPNATTVQPGKWFIMKKIDNSANTVTILTTSGQTIEGNGSGDLVLADQWDTLEVVSDGTNWLIKYRNIGIDGGGFLVSY